MTLTLEALQKAIETAKQHKPCVVSSQEEADSLNENEGYGINPKTWKVGDEYYYLTAWNSEWKKKS